MKKFAINTASNLLNAALVGGILFLVAAPAHAWGEREQGILTGVIGTLIIQDIQRGNNGHTTHGQHYPQQPVVIQHTTRNCGVEVRTVYTDGGTRSITDTVDACTGRLIQRVERKSW